MPPLARATDWVDVELDLGDGPRRYRRETNTMPQWAGSCWYYLRYLDPENDDALVDPEIERYWMRSGGVDLYVGGVEHAVLHLLYARFWHKVLFDLGYVGTPEPFARLFNQGYVQAAAYTDERGFYVDAAEVERCGEPLVPRGAAGHPQLREDGQEPQERRHAGRGHRAPTARTRCGSTSCSSRRSTRTARGTRRRSSGSRASCSGCGARSSTRRAARSSWPTSRRRRSSSARCTARRTPSPATSSGCTSTPRSAR